MAKLLFKQKIQWQILLLLYLQWFFGNIYELLVFTPNVTLASSIPEAIKLIQSFWSVSNPTWYFLPWSPITILFTWFLIIRNWRKISSSGRHYYTLMLIASFCITFVTAYIVVNVNTKFYFSEIHLSDKEISHYWWIGFHLGNVRILLELIILYLVGTILKKGFYSIK